mmetsp:Transcript_12721/g.30881  ORF Transcript_12721/g.30881 Transcript_12721/m.30881 type:complete len:884 (+) Transcript_12721:397-3048(+)
MSLISPTLGTGAGARARAGGSPSGGESSAAVIATFVSQSGGTGSATTALPDATNSSSSGTTTTKTDLGANNSNNKKPSSTPNSPETTSSRGSNSSNSKKKDDDRPKLRKGKWTIEEEEYTSRIIQYFSTGLLTLPDGATLRSYLAEKLNCDPMRITKKFTGACCLGRRAYHLRDRPRASPAEVEMARLDLQHLEQRFTLRLEHEQSGLPLPPRHEVLAAQPPPSALLGGGVQGSLYQLQKGMSPSAATASGMVTSAPWLQPSSHSNGAPTNASVAAAAPAGVPNIMNPSAVLNQFGANVGHSRMVLPGTNLPFTSGPAAAAQSTIASFQNAAPERQNPSSKLPATSLQQLLLQVAAAQQQQQQSNVPTQPSGVEQQRNNGNNDGASVQFLQSVLSSIALAQATNGTNQGYGTSSNNNGSVQSMAPSPYASLPGLVQSPNPAPVPSIAASSAPSSGTPTMPGVTSNGFGASLFASSQAPAQPLAQGSFQQQMVQKASSKPVLNAAVESSNPTTCSSIQNSDAPQSNRLSQLKAAYEKQQEALRLAYEKTLKEHEEQDKNMTTKKKVPTSSASTSSKASVSTGGKAASNSESLVSPAEQLQRSYQAHLASLQKDGKPKSGRRTSSSSNSAPRAARAGDKKSKKKKKVAGSNRGQPDGKSKEEEAGVLLGFLNSVRSSYEVEGGDDDDPDFSKASVNANTKSSSIQKKSSGGSVGGKSAGGSATTKQKKKQYKGVLISSSKKPASKSGNGKRQRDSQNSTSNPDPARSDLQAMKDAAITALMQSNQNLKSKQVSEASSNNSSSQPSTEQSSSSIEDSDSKSEKTDNTSGEESTEEEEVINNKRSSPTTAKLNKGPPRKRLKSMKESNEFTTANLLEHSKRMDRESK